LPLSHLGQWYKNFIGLLLLGFPFAYLVFAQLFPQQLQQLQQPSTDTTTTTTTTTISNNSRAITSKSPPASIDLAQFSLSLHNINMKMFKCKAETAPLLVAANG